MTPGTTVGPGALPFARRMAGTRVVRALGTRVAALRHQIFLDALARSGASLGDDVVIPEGSTLTAGTTIRTGTACSGPLFVEGPGAVDIGAWCAIGHGFRVVTTAHEMRAVNMHMPLQIRLGLPDHYEAAGPVTIGGGCWIGDQVTVLGGVGVAPGAVLGARSVVTRDVRPFAIAAGNPAREVRRRFDDDVVEALLETRWWEWPIDRLLRNRDFFELRPGELTGAELLAAVRP